MADKILISGLPGSGNRIILHMLLKNGCASDDVKIQHIPSAGMQEEYAKVIVPIRRRDVWLVAVDRHDWGVLKFVQEELKCTKEEAIEMYEARRKERLAPWSPGETFRVEYEYIVRMPNEYGEFICEFVGVPFRGWAEEIVDGNAKYMDEVRATAPRSVSLTEGADERLNHGDVRCCGCEAVYGESETYGTTAAFRAHIGLKHRGANA